MADVATPTAAAAASAAGGALAAPFLASIGVDPGSMVAGLMGVVMVQVFLQRTAPQGIGPIFMYATASMFAATLGAPLLGPGVVALAPDGWQWLKEAPHDHVKAVSAALCGGFAQPGLIWLRGRFFPAKSPPAPDAVKEGDR